MHKQPGPVLKRALRAPTALYSVGAGRLLGHRFLLLTHRGRHSGRVYRTLLEVVHWDPTQCEAIVMSGFGATANWYENIVAGGAVEIAIANKRFHPSVRPLEPQEAARVLAEYEHRNRLLTPIIRAVLTRLAPFSYDGSPPARLRLVETLPLVAFTPRTT